MTQVGLEFIARDSSRAGINSFRGNLSTTSRTVQSLGRSLLAVAGVGGGLYMLQRGLKTVITESSRAQETLGKFNVVFGENAKEAARWAEEFGDSVGRATQDVQEWMAGVQDLFVPLGYARDKATELSESLVKLAVDVASFSNKADADVIRDFTSALVGNHETVRKYGIMISENAIKQEALSQGLNKTYKELTDLEKVSIRMTLIQKGSADAQGDAIRTGDSFANQLKRSGANAKELAVILAGPLTKALAGVLKVTNEVSGDIIKDLKPALTQIERISELINEYEKLKIKRLQAYKAGLPSELPPWDPNALSRLEPQMLPGGAQYLMPEHMQRITAKEDERQKAAAAAREAEAIKRGAAESAYSPVMLENLDRDNEIALRRIKITADMYSGMNGRGNDYYNSQKAMLDIQYDEYSEYVNDKVLLDKWYGSELQKITSAGNASGVADTREKLASIRALDTMTRMEKIQNLKAYMAEHADTLAGVAEAEKILNDEILSIQSSRMDAMKVYQAELREDMQNTALYISDKFAEASRSIESGLSSAFVNLQQEGSNFKSFMCDVFGSIRDSFIKMLGDMAARAMMAAAISPLMSGLSGALGSLFSQGAAVGAGGQPFTPSNPYGLQTNPVPTRHSGWVPAGVPSFHGGRGLDSNEQVAVIRNDELIAPAGQIVRSPFSRGGSAPSINIFNESGKQIEQKGEPEFDGERWVVSLVAKNISEGGSLSKLMKR